LKWTLAAKATAAMMTVRTIDNVAERFMAQLSFFVGRAVFEPSPSRTGRRPTEARGHVSKEIGLMPLFRILMPLTRDVDDSTDAVNP